jgi:hypothetical protein
MQRYEITVKLYQYPTEIGLDTWANLFNQPAIDSTIVLPYSFHIDSTPNPKIQPMALGSYKNWGKKIHWKYVGVTDTVQPSTVYLQPNELLDTVSGNTIGYFEFNSLDTGKYVLVISRPGFVTRFARIKLEETDATTQLLGHRELIPGDIPGTLHVADADYSLILHNPTIIPQYDFNADGVVDNNDIFLIKSYLDFYYILYEDTLKCMLDEE